MVDKNWTFEEAWEEHERISEARKSKPDATDSDPSLPIYQWSALHHLDELERSFNAGDDFALLHAIRVCANHDLLLPSWVSRAYIARFDKVLNYRVRSWDKAFGAPYRKGVHVAQARQRREKRFPVYIRVQEILMAEPSTPIDENLFERVGKEFGVGRSFASDRYYEAKKLLDSDSVAKNVAKKLLDPYKSEFMPPKS